MCGSRVYIGVRRFGDEGVGESIWTLCMVLEQGPSPTRIQTLNHKP